jgi:hypothetical protein
MATIEINDMSAMSMAAQVFTELSDEQYAKLYNRIVREGKYRRNLDFEALVKKTQRSWGAEPVKHSKSVDADETMGL